MAKNEGLCQVHSTNPGDWVDDLPNGRPAPGIQMASVLENQCVTFAELAEAYDLKEWQK